MNEVEWKPGDPVYDAPAVDAVSIELAAMESIVNALEALDARAQARVARWVYSRYGATGEEQ